MKGEGGALVALASSIADGSPVDWDQAEADAVGPYELELVRSLRLIASIGEVHRSAEDGQPNGAARGQVSRIEVDDRRGRIVGRIQPSALECFPSEGAFAGDAPREERRWGHLVLRERVAGGRRPRRRPRH